MQEAYDPSKLMEFPVAQPDGSDERRLSPRVDLSELQLPVRFLSGNVEYAGVIRDMSAIGLRLLFEEEFPAARIGATVEVELDLLGNVFDLAAIVRRIEEPEISLWLPQVVSGDSHDGIGLGDFVQGCLHHNA